MKNNLLESSKHIHLLGIGGIGVSGLAGILKEKRKSISGSDCEKSAITEKLEKSGVKIFIGDSELPSKTDLVVYSLAIPKNDPVFAQARKKGIPVLSYPQAVGELTKDFFTIAVCGTHGKSTIVSMISKILIENGFDPTVIVGTKLKELGNLNYRTGKSKIFVLEACEYKRAFLNYRPNIIIMQTLSPDHLDYYHDFKDYLSAFKQFSDLLPKDGYFFGNLDDEDVHDIFKYLQEEKFPHYNTFTYGIKYENGNFHLKNTNIIKNGAVLGKLNLKIPGEHNRSNALAAFCCANIFGITPKQILRSLNNYTGAFRRFEIKGKLKKTLVIDDYGHHPEEIKATLQAAREKFKDKKICVVFQPHQYSRTAQLLHEFGKSFAEADLVIIPNIYQARDTKQDIKSVSAEKLTDEIKKNNTNAIFGDGFENTITYLKKHCSNFGAIITMGAGDVWKIADSLL